MKAAAVTLCFYRAMHYSAKRGIAIARRQSVCPSVCNVGGSGPHRLEILETNCMSIWPNTFAHLHCTPRGTLGNFAETRCRVEKCASWSTKAAISLIRVKIDETLLWTAYRKSPMLFQTVPFRPH